jgi:mannose-6-phosphate isomerase-like protein (cupin superfamily)
MSYIGNIHELVMRNDNFREVVFTGDSTQIAVMCIPVGSELGEGVFAKIEHTLYVISGVCDIIIDHKRTQITGGDVVVVGAGSRHNLINSGEESLRVIEVHVPPRYADGIVHSDLSDALEDVENV